MSISELVAISLFGIDFSLQVGHFELKLVISSEKLIDLSLELDILLVLDIELTD